jgi:hypothetical protein
MGVIRLRRYWPFGRYLLRVIGAVHVIGFAIFAHRQIITSPHHFTSAIPKFLTETHIRISTEQLRIAHGLSCF